jgi:hypothetical protein
MYPAHVVHQCHRHGGGRVWVRKPHGGWRSITFESGRGQLAKLLGLCGVLDRIGSATAAVVRGRLLVAQVAPGPEVGSQVVPRAGPCQPICAQAP